MCWAVLVLCFWIQSGLVPVSSFLLSQQLFLLDVVPPMWWFADITLDPIALYTAQRLALLVTDEQAKRLPTICPLLNS